MHSYLDKVENVAHQPVASEEIVLNEPKLSASTLVCFFA